MAYKRKNILDSLRPHAKRLEATHMRKIFADNPSRFNDFSASACGILLDYSKNKIDERALAALFDVAHACKVENQRDKMWAGEPINASENRSVMHMALRYFGNKKVMVDGEDIMPKISHELSRIKDFSNKIRNGEIKSSTGENFTDIVNIGIGGSDLGPQMVTRALSPYMRNDIHLHYVSNVDGAHLSDTLKSLNPKTTLFIIASKTFTTIETMTNANSAKDWLVAALGKKAIAKHFAAISTNISNCNDFGIENDKIFGFWGWVGGRYSIWSAIGMPVALAIGYDNFEKLLQGAYEMDEHFRSAPLEQNLPVILALIGIWNRNALDYSTFAMLPYDQRLGRFPAYLQQLDMESNGKSVDKSGFRVEYNTGAVVFGEAGTNGQHAFYQLLHQGTDIVPVDFLVAVNPYEKQKTHHEILLANCFAQSEALMNGKSLTEVIEELANSGMSQEEIKKLAPHKVFEGNRPSNTLLYKKLDPKTLGSLIALYEHKVFVQGVVWDINSFDQWGVELGKQLATNLLERIKDNAAQSNENPSTAGLIKHYHKIKE
jgi:glucose-6-phosphate isomerase